MEKGITMLTKTATRRLGEILVNLGYVSDVDIAKALEIQARNPGKKIGRLLVDMNCLNDQQVFQAIELQWDDWLKGNAA